MLFMLFSVEGCTEGRPGSETILGAMEIDSLSIHHIPAFCVRIPSARYYVSVYRWIFPGISFNAGNQEGREDVSLSQICSNTPIIFDSNHIFRFPGDSHFDSLFHLLLHETGAACNG